MADELTAEEQTRLRAELAEIIEDFESEWRRAPAGVDMDARRFEAKVKVNELLSALGADTLAAAGVKEPEHWRDERLHDKEGRG